MCPKFSYDEGKSYGFINQEQWKLRSEQVTHFIITSIYILYYFYMIKTFVEAERWILKAIYKIK